MIIGFLESFISTYKISLNIKSKNNKKIIKYILNCHDLINFFLIIQFLIFNFFSLIFFF